LVGGGDTKAMSVLCNQGCGTHVTFINGKPYNLDGKTPHSETCLSLKFGKFWGGKYNTIPMYYIKDPITESYELCNHAQETRSIDDILLAIEKTVEHLGVVAIMMQQQEERNTKWNEEFEQYKANLVKEQKDRKLHRVEPPYFTTADKMDESHV